MAGKLSPRANVRLKLDKGTVLLRQGDHAPITCVLMDLSEGGCQCRISPVAIEPGESDPFRDIITPGASVSLAIQEPPNLANFQADAEIRWVRAGKANTIEFGLKFKELGFVQKNMLSHTLVIFASDKLRSQKSASDILKTDRKTVVLPAATPPGPSVNPMDTPFGTKRPFIPPPPAPAAAANPATTPVPARPQSYPGGTPLPFRGTRSVLPPGAIPEPPTPTAPPAIPSPSFSAGYDNSGGNAYPRSSLNAPDSDRQVRHKLVVPVQFQLTDSKGAALSGSMLSGNTVDFAEGGVQIVGPPPDCCPPERLLALGYSVNITLIVQPRNISGLCRVRTMKTSDEFPGRWLYGLQIIGMSEDDRKKVRELYIRAGFSVMLRKRTR